MGARAVTKLTSDPALVVETEVTSLDTYRFPADAQRIILEIDTASAADTVTVVSQATPGPGLARADTQIKVPANSKARIVISRDGFVDSGEAVTVRHSATSGVKASAFYIT